jgi:hypothetical protein
MVLPQYGCRDRTRTSVLKIRSRNSATLLKANPTLGLRNPLGPLPRDEVTT